MTDMEPLPGNIRKHVQNIEFRLFRPILGLISLLFSPFFLPLLLYRQVVVVFLLHFSILPKKLLYGKNRTLVFKRENRRVLETRRPPRRAVVTSLPVSDTPRHSGRGLRLLLQRQIDEEVPGDGPSMSVLPTTSNADGRDPASQGSDR